MPNKIDITIPKIVFPEYSISLKRVRNFLRIRCVEQVDIDDYIEGTQSNRLVVEGLITNKFKRHSVKLTRTGEVATDPYELVSGVELTITDGTTNFLLTEIRVHQ